MPRSGSSSDEGKHDSHRKAGYAKAAKDMLKVHKNILSVSRTKRGMQINLDEPSVSTRALEEDQDNAPGYASGSDHEASGNESRHSRSSLTGRHSPDLLATVSTKVDDIDKRIDKITNTIEEIQKVVSTLTRSINDLTSRMCRVEQSVKSCHDVLKATAKPASGLSINKMP